LKPYAELLEFNQPSPIRKVGFTRIRDAFPELVYNTNRVAPFRFPDPERIMEFAGRWDYGENNARKLGEKSKVGDKEVPILQKYLSMGHESMIEMGDATVFIECSRVVSHEIVRHRLASYQQESQRFTLQILDEDSFYVPEGLEPYIERSMRNSYYEDAKTYQRLLDAGVAKQIARYVLPNAMRTRMIMKANAREWRHILKLRTDRSVQPEMRELALQIYDQLVDIFPNAMSGVLDGERPVR
jgi:thymidylate synthase (FAD)